MSSFFVDHLSYPFGFWWCWKELDLWVLAFPLLLLHALISREPFWTLVCLNKRISISFQLVALSRVFKWFKGSEDAMFVHIVFKRKLICARTLGSFLILFKMLFGSYHNILFCPIGSLDLLIACLLHLLKPASLCDFFLQSLILTIWFDFLQIFLIE